MALIMARKDRGNPLYGTNAGTQPDGIRPAGVRAPYVPFAAVMRLLAAFQTFQPHGKEARQIVVDMEGPRAIQSLGALRFLNLLDLDDQPTAHLAELLAALGTSAWPAALAQSLRRAFRPLFANNLARMTREEFEIEFEKIFGGTKTVQRKSRTFFVHAAMQANIPLDPAVVRASKPRAIASFRPTRTRQAIAGMPPESTSIERATNPVGHAPAGRDVPLSVRLVSEVDTGAMDDEVKQAFWTLMRHIKDRGI